jgi:type IV secretion system protein VirD4
VIIAGYNLRLMIIFQGMSQLSAPNLYGPYGAETLAINCKLRSLYYWRQKVDNASSTRLALSQTPRCTL